MGLVLTVLLLTSIASFGSGDNSCCQVNSNAFDVLSYGAVGDGEHDDSKAFLGAWEAACGAGSGATTITIPGEKTYLLNPLRFEGPCKSSSINVQIAGTLVPPDLEAWSDEDTKKWIIFSQVDGLVVNGNGLIDGRGSKWWSKYEKQTHSRPTASTFEKCNNLQLDSLRYTNSPRNHISIHRCNGVTISNLDITAPEDSPNTDGINLSLSSNVKIHDCTIGTGDDCVAMNGGTANVFIDRIACGPGHGISIGSLGEDGSTDTVEEVHVSNVKFEKTKYGARIKTWQGGSGYARKISYKDITFVEASHPIIINQYYCDSHSSAPCKNQTKAVRISDITFDGVHGTSATEIAIQLSCSQSYGCRNIMLNNINIQPIDSGKGSLSSSCINAQGVSKNTNPPVSCLSQSPDTPDPDTQDPNTQDPTMIYSAGISLAVAKIKVIKIFKVISSLVLFKYIV